MSNSSEKEVLDVVVNAIMEDLTDYITVSSVDRVAAIIARHVSNLLHASEDAVAVLVSNTRKAAARASAALLSEVADPGEEEEEEEEGASGCICDCGEEEQVLAEDAAEVLSGLDCILKGMFGQIPTPKKKAEAPTPKEESVSCVHIVVGAPKKAAAKKATVKETAEASAAEKPEPPKEKAPEGAATKKVVTKRRGAKASPAMVAVPAPVLAAIMKALGASGKPKAKKASAGTKENTSGTK